MVEVVIRRRTKPNKVSVQHKAAQPLVQVLVRPQVKTSSLVTRHHPDRVNSSKADLAPLTIRLVRKGAVASRPIRLNRAVRLKARAVHRLARASNNFGIHNS